MRHERLLLQLVDLGVRNKLLQRFLDEQVTLLLCQLVVGTHQIGLHAMGLLQELGVRLYLLDLVDLDEIVDSGVFLEVVVGLAEIRVVVGYLTQPKLVWLELLSEIFDHVCCEPAELPADAHSCRRCASL